MPIIEDEEGGGVIGHNHNCVLFTTRCACCDDIIDPITIELMACQDALHVEANHGLQHFLIETDCQVVLDGR